MSFLVLILIIVVLVISLQFSELTGFGVKGIAKDWCKDSDAKNIYTRGVIETSQGVMYTDYCYDRDSVVELYCNGKKMSYLIYSCDDVCRNGICVD